MDKFEQLSFDFDNLKEFINARISVDESDIKDFIVSCICKIWGANKLYHSDYAKAVESITKDAYTPAQIMTAMSCCSEEGREIPVPAFMVALTDYDIRHGSVYSLKSIDNIVNLLIAMSFINGDFTIEEANALTEISDMLTGFCQSKGITGYTYSFNIDSRITPAGTDYWSEDKKEEEEPASEEDSDTPMSLDDALNRLQNTLQNLSFNLVVSSDPEKTDENSSEGEVQNLAVKKNEDKTLEELLSELDSLVGLDNVKNDIHSLLNFIKVSKLREERGMKVPEISYHLVFTGNPGTGKTTVARLVAQLYYKMGILQQGQLVEADRSTLVAGYLGQTAIKVQKVIQSALDGVLFIDEAYSLANEENDSYGKEAIETLLKAMEDNRDKLVVIVAGYDNLMRDFINSNPGLRSRFNKYFKFNDYNGEEMFRIFQRFCKQNGYVLEEEAESRILTKFNSMYEHRSEHFGNARTVRNIFERAINNQADRIALLSSITDNDLARLSTKDVTSALEGMIE